ncbi:MAG: hypothetical protein KC516_03475 [Nanoarchaeota archaeon]|nr:hypothetical protein [Nanoarchaeota archaeon]
MNEYLYLFVGEERSEKAKQMGVIWRDKRLAASHLYKALDNIGIEWDNCDFANVFEGEIDKIKSFNGPVIAMGRKVEKALKKENISHYFIYHPATRGSLRRIENYLSHVEEALVSLPK